MHQFKKKRGHGSACGDKTCAQDSVTLHSGLFDLDQTKQNRGRSLGEDSGLVFFLVQLLIYSVFFSTQQM